MTLITEQIYIGNSQDARNEAALKAAGIYNILNVAEDLPDALSWKDGFRVFHVGLSDGDNNSNLYKAAELVLGAIVMCRGKVLVHCHEGKSRSAFVVALHLSYLLDSNLYVCHPAEAIAKAIKFIQEKRPEIDIKEAHRKAFGIS